jgi:hypothetical protein
VVGDGDPQPRRETPGFRVDLRPLVIAPDPAHLHAEAAALGTDLAAELLDRTGPGFFDHPIVGSGV